MIELPVGLASWAPQLSALPVDLALAVAPWVGRMALAVGPFATTRSRQGGEPDGYSGLSRRGPYERLVTAEWGIAELSPDEFLRRAAAGEHLFLDLARCEPQGAVRSIAIVSAGPAQLGSPRLAHIAAIIVLARRAASAGAGFAWGVLEDPHRRLHETVDAESIQYLLAARTAVPATDEAFEGWMEDVGRVPSPDLWFIGSDDDATNAARVDASRLIVRDVLEPYTRALDIEVERPGRSARARLELPAPDQCARLLRDPFARAGGGTPRDVTAKGRAIHVRFAPGARRVIVGLADGSFESWPIPSSPRDALGNPRRWTPPRNHAVVAMGVGSRATLAATATRDDPTAIELYYGNSHRVRVMLPKEVVAILAKCLAADEPPRVGTCALLRLRDHARTDLILDLFGTLLVLPGFSLWPAPGTVLTALPFNAASDDGPRLALATACFPTSLVWAELHEDGQIHVIEASSSGNRRVAMVEARATPHVEFGFSLPQRSSWGIVATAWDAAHHRVAAPELAGTTLQATDPVVGVCLSNGIPGLLTRTHPNRLAWIIGDRCVRLPTSPAPIVAVAVCPSHPNVAWVTEAGELVVYSMRHHAVLFRRAPGSEQ